MMKRMVVPLFLLLGACSSTPTRPLPPVIDGQTGEPAPGVPYEPPEQTVPVPLPPSSSSGGAVVALLDQAETYHRSGDIDNEAATIERALRIDPKNASLWSRLAAVRLEQGRPGQAEQLALKSNALAGEDTVLQARNWRLVARARWSVNDGSGARAAEKKARDLGG
ncbi:MAG: tetratricopeptide repeat protein [Thiogranum sp.]